MGEKNIEDNNGEGKTIENQLKVQENEILRHVFRFLQNNINRKDLLLYNLSSATLSACSGVLNPAH